MAKATSHPDRRLISSEDVQGTNVYGIGDESIGEIDHLLIEKISGRVAYAVMSFGGFLGVAHSHYPIPWSALKYDTALEGYRTGITEAQLKEALTKFFYAKVGVTYTPPVPPSTEQSAPTPPQETTTPTVVDSTLGESASNLAFTAVA